MKYLLLFIILFLLFRYVTYLLSSRANKTHQFQNRPPSTGTPTPNRFKDAVDADFEVIEDEDRKRS